MPSKQEVFRERVVQSSTNCTEISAKSILKKIKIEIVAASTVYHILRSPTTARKQGSGRPAKIMNREISEKGFSKPWFKPSGLAINEDVYQNECLKKILIPFLQKHHVFWPDKASSHYAKKHNRC